MSGPAQAPIAEAENALMLLGGFATQRHIMLCVDPDKDKCCPRGAGQEAWLFLKRRLGELKLGGAQGVLRTKAAASVCAWLAPWRWSIPRASGIILVLRRC